MPKISFKNRDFILDVAIRQFARKGYKATTMKSIAKACGMNKASLYYYFPSKKELYRDALKRVYSEMSSSMANSMAQSKDYIERAKDLISLTIDFLSKNKELLELAHRALMDRDRIVIDMIRKEGKTLIGSLKDFIETGIKEGRIKNFPPEYIIQIVLGACAFYFISGEIGRVIFEEKDLYSKEIVENYKSILTHILTCGLIEEKDKINEK